MRAFPPTRQSRKLSHHFEPFEMFDFFRSSKDEQDALCQRFANYLNRTAPGPQKWRSANQASSRHCRDSSRPHIFGSAARTAARSSKKRITSCATCRADTRTHRFADTFPPPPTPARRHAHPPTRASVPLRRDLTVRYQSISSGRNGLDISAEWSEFRSQTTHVAVNRARSDFEISVPDVVQ